MSRGAVLMLCAVVGAFCLQLGRCAGRKEAPVVTVTDTVPARVYADASKEMDRLAAENFTLREKLDGLRALKPVERTVYDTLVREIVTPVSERVVVTDGRIEALVLRPESGGYAPVRERFNYSNCDERLEFVRGHVVCDPARLGHLTLFVRAGMTSRLADDVPNLGALAIAGLRWMPYHRSTTQIELSGDGQGRASLTFSTGWRLF